MNESAAKSRASGDRLCETCGRIHNLLPVPGRPEFWGTWADPDDGHPYKTESWETVARRYGYTPEREREFEQIRLIGKRIVDEHADTLRKLAEDD